MFLEDFLTALLRYWYTLPIILLIHVVYNKFGNGINRYPGHWLAGWTNWWRFYDVSCRKAEHTHLKLHRKFGDVVRLGPNVLSFSNPRAVREIYGLSKKFQKTQFYPVQTSIAKGERVWSLFSTLDESYHSELRRHVNSAFSMSTLVSYEPLVNMTTRAFLRQTRKLFSETAEICDFSRWLQFYAFDVIGQITFSRRLGFIDAFEDVDGIVEAIADILSYSGPIGQMPWLDTYFLRKNPIRMFLMKQGLITSSNPVGAFALSRMSERRAAITEQEDEKGDFTVSELENRGAGVDFLTRLLAAQRKAPEFMSDRRVLTVITSLVNAGSDTTASSLSAVFYFLLKNPRSYRKLMEELQASVKNGNIDYDGDDGVSWADSQKLQYLDAVITEAFRLFPAVGLLLERHVPEGGAVICGHSVPENTIVGCNAWVIHRQPDIFGQDVDDFRPERWIEADPQQLKEMRATMFHFGAGVRTCIGRNISTLEMYKLVPTLLLNFELQLAEPELEWKTENCWFVRQLGFNVRIKSRNPLQ